jgi:ABC-type branched-subunit amino acid transport system substrate-binding protein
VKRLTALVVLLAVAIVLAGCQAPARLGVSTTVVGVRGTCNTSAVVEVGAALPLSGPLASVGRAELTGLELGVTQVDQSGGVLTSHRCLELMYKDDHSNPSVDDQALLDLAYRERVSMVVGPFVALGDRADGTHLGALGVTATSFSTADATFAPRTFPYTYPVGPSDSVEAKVLAAYAAKHHWHHVTALGSGSTSSDQALDAFTAAARRAGLEVTPVRRAIDSEASAATALGAAGGGRTEAVVVVGDGATLAPVLAARHALGSTVTVLSSGLTTAPTIARAAQAGVDVLVPSALAVGRSLPHSLASFRSHVLAALHRGSLDGPLTPYAQAYDAVEMFAAAANGVNADDPNSLRTYIENANFDGLLGSYNYTAQAHGGIDGSQLAVVPLDSLSNGVFAHTGAR